MSSEDYALERIKQITGREISECSCTECQNQCRTACLGTPQDVLKLIEAGYKDKLMPSIWLVGSLLGLCPPIPLFAAKSENGYCVFFKNGLCELHGKGLKPTEGKLSHHTLNHSNLVSPMSLSYNVAKEWMLQRNYDVIVEVAAEMGLASKEKLLSL